MGAGTAAKYSLQFDHKLVLSFFMEFARFEYALKRSGFLRKGIKDAKPDWNSFAAWIRAHPSNTQSLRAAGQLLMTRPPKKQVVVGGALSWEECARDTGDTDEAYLLRLMRVVRNNLFHGGKFPYPDGPVQDIARDRELLTAGLDILRACRTLAPQLESFFSEAA
jgi:hypothetical protein